MLAPSEPYPFRERHRAELERVAPALFVDGQDLFWVGGAHGGGGGAAGARWSGSEPPNGLLRHPSASGKRKYRSGHEVDGI